MTALGKTVQKVLGDCFANAGYLKTESPLGIFTLYHSESDGHHRYIGFQRGMGGTIRTFLGVDVIPGILPPLIRGDQPIEAECPSYSMIGTADTHKALEVARELLVEAGFAWLNDPYARTPTQWREHGILIRDHTVGTPALIGIPEKLDPKTLSAIRKGIVKFEHTSLSDLKTQLSGRSEIEFEEIGRAEWPEFESLASRAGLLVEFRNVHVNA